MPCGSQEPGAFELQSYTTPSFLLAAVRRVFAGPIDLDPCSSEQVKAMQWAMDYHVLGSVRSFSVLVLRGCLCECMLTHSG